MCEVFCAHAATLYQSVCRKTSLCQQRRQRLGGNMRGLWLVGELVKRMILM